MQFLDASQQGKSISLLIINKSSFYFAISKDGYRFTDVNSGQALIIGSQLAEQKGVRNPHLVRGPDGAFYLAMTDLHIF